jgi:hypothetical protein
MKYTRFQDIPQFTKTSGYSVHVSWFYLEKSLKDFAEGNPVELDPDFQRAHVWTEDKQVAYVEFCLRGGRSSTDIYWNCPTWQRQGKFKTAQPIVLIDGKQRIESVRKFMRNELKAFGSTMCEYTDNMRIMQDRFTFHINDLGTRAEVLQWYLDLNAGGVVHTSEELDRVRQLLEKERNP